ncbi:TIM barrel protein [Pelagibius litoralis]|uniref:TIM barrel protein n=1 Tax=Pelagibius litoralis TaxID=374515 RepID=A0A967EYH8_9PROT|nr:TIM barrel protein [Pelagibius litoralis]NIA69776.1 TIM barrel protein [Pelagibius litoralis]
MPLSIGNAPCSWGVEFADDPRNPDWQQVLDDAAAAGYGGLELGPIGYMPEDPAVLRRNLAERRLSLIGGVVFRPFHDPAKWDEVQAASRRTCQALSAHGAKHLVLIDSIAARRAPTAGRAAEAERMSETDWRAFIDRIRSVARMGAEEYGLSVALHAHAAGYMEFEDELERALGEIDVELLSVCLDTGHCVYAGFDPVDFYRRHADRVSYIHFKDVDPDVKARVVEERIGFYDACAQGLFCTLGQGAVDFEAMRDALTEKGFDGWATVEQDCDPAGDTAPLADAKANLTYLRSIGLAA